MVDTGDFGMTQAIRSKVAQRRIIGRRGLQVSGLGLGTAPLGGLYSDLSDEQALATVAAAYEAGVRFFDTAPHYGHTKAEHRLGDALRRYPRDRYVLSTKTGRHFVPRTTPYDGSEGWQDPLPFQAIFDYTHDGILRSFEDSQRRDRHSADPRHRPCHARGEKPALLEATDRRRRFSRARRIAFGGRGQSRGPRG
jgi:D-threo-aldose 1-dehydrogenase